MSSTYSTNLRTELIGSGDQAGTWGTTTNSTLGSILEQAIAGVSGGPYISGTYPVVNFPTDADITLTANNGAVDQSRSMVLVITSTGSLTATRNVIAPASASKVYIIKNSTTGAQSIQIKYSTGTGITIPNGQTMVVYGNGTNFYDGVTALSSLAVVGNETVGGTLIVTGATTLSSTLAVTGATTLNTTTATTVTSSDNSTNVATTAYVKSNLSGLGTMSTQNSSSVTITGGTINGVSGTAASLNVGFATSATTATNATNATNSTNITNSGGWSVTPSGTKLYFNYNGTNVGSLDSSGNFIVTGNVTAYGTP